MLICHGQIDFKPLCVFNFGAVSCKIKLKKKMGFVISLSHNFLPLLLTLQHDEGSDPKILLVENRNRQVHPVEGPTGHLQVF